MLRFASQNTTSGAPVEYEQKLREIHESGELMERTCFGHKDCFSYRAKGGVSSSTQSQLISREETQNAGQKQTWLWIDGYKQTARNRQQRRQGGPCEGKRAPFHPGRGSGSRSQRGTSRAPKRNCSRVHPRGSQLRWPPRKAGSPAE